MVDIRQIGRDLGVRALEGSVRRAGNRLRVTAQLIDVRPPAVKLGPSATIATSAHIFAVQDEIATSVAGVIEPALADAEQQRVLRKPPERLGCVGGLTSEGYGTSTNTDRAETRLRRPSFAEPSRLRSEFRAWPLRICTGSSNGRFEDHYSIRALLGGSKAPRVEEALIAVSLDARQDAIGHAVLAHMRMWGSEWECGDRRSPHRGRA